MRPPADVPDAGAVLAALAGLLEAHGQRRLHGAADAPGGLAVLSVAGGVTAWLDARARVIRWTAASGREVRWPMADLAGAAAQLAGAAGAGAAEE